MLQLGNAPQPLKTKTTIYVLVAIEESGLKFNAIEKGKARACDDNYFFLLRSVFNFCTVVSSCPLDRTKHDAPRCVSKLTWAWTLGHPGELGRKGFDQKGFFFARSSA